MPDTLRNEVNATPRTLPGVKTVAGPIYAGYGKSAIIPAATEFLYLRELAHRMADSGFPVRTSIGQNIGKEEVQQAYELHVAATIGNLAAFGPASQLRVLGELVRFVEFHQDVTGNEGVLMTAIQSTWPFASPSLAYRALKVWRKYVPETGISANHRTYAYDEATRTLGVFLPEELKTISGLEATLALISRIQDLQKTVGAGGRGDGSKPDFKSGDSGSWTGTPGDSRSLEGIVKGLTDPGTDYSSGQRPAGSTTGIGQSGRVFNSGGTGSLDSLENWADAALGKGALDFGGGSVKAGTDLSSIGGGGIEDLLGRSGPKPVGAHSLGKGIGTDPLSGDGPFSSSFIGSPNNDHQEIMDIHDKKGTFEALKSAGIVTMGVGAGYVAGPSWGLGLIVVSAGFKLTEYAAREISRVDANIRADEKAQDKADQQKADAEKERIAKEKAEKDKKAAEAAKDVKSLPDAPSVGVETLPPAPPAPPPKGSSGAFDDDPYGGGGSHPSWQRLDQVPVDDIGTGGVGPKWLNAMPIGDWGGGGGPKWLALPIGDDQGGGTPKSSFAAVLAQVGGPGLQSFCVQTGARTMTLVGTVKLYDDGSVRDAGAFQAFVR